MGIQVPGEVQWLVPIVVGTNWPRGDETALRRLGQAWRQAGAQVGEVTEAGESTAAAATASMRGEAAQAFEQHWASLARDDPRHLLRLRELCERLGDNCDDAAIDIEYTKLTIIAALIALAAEIAALSAAAVPTLGASAAAIPAAQAATRVAIQTVFRELVASMLRQVAVTGGTDVAIQGLQLARGDRDSWDWSKTGEATVSGTVSGGFELFPAGATRSLDEAMVHGAGRGAAEGLTSTAVDAAITGGDVSAGDLAYGATSGAASGGASGGNDAAEGAGTGPAAEGAGDPLPPAAAPDAGSIRAALDGAPPDAATDSE